MGFLFSQRYNKKQTFKEINQQQTNEMEFFMKPKNRQQIWNLNYIQRDARQILFFVYLWRNSVLNELLFELFKTFPPRNHHVVQLKGGVISYICIKKHLSIMIGKQGIDQCERFLICYDKKKLQQFKIIVGFFPHFQNSQQSWQFRQHWHSGCLFGCFTGQLQRRLEPQNGYHKWSKWLGQQQCQQQSSTPSPQSQPSSFIVAQWSRQLVQNAGTFEWPENGAQRKIVPFKTQLKWFQFQTRLTFFQSHQRSAPQFRLC